MNFDQYFAAIRQSGRERWNHIACWGAGSGPSYRERLGIAESMDYSQQRLEVQQHSDIAVYKNDLAISMAWGFPHLENFSEPWVTSYSDKHASSDYLDFFFNGTLIHRVLYVVVDGGRVSLPLPDPTTMEVDSLEYDVVRLMQELSGTTYPFEEYFARGGLKRKQEYL